MSLVEPREFTPKPLTAETVIGAASPLWGLFAGAAVTGVAFWWMTRWTQPANLEALFSGRGPKLPDLALAEPGAVALKAVEPFVAAIEATAAPVAELVEESVAQTEAVVETAAETVAELAAEAEPAVEAAAEPVVEAMAEAPVLVEESVEAVVEPVIEMWAEAPATVEDAVETLSEPVVDAMAEAPVAAAAIVEAATPKARKPKAAPVEPTAEPSPPAE